MSNNNLGLEESIIKRGSISCVVFPSLSSTGFIRHGFALKTGGVSKGCFDSLNLSFTRGDVQQDVEENFRRVAAFFNTTPENIVSAYQTHTNYVMRVGKEEAGRGVTKERLYPDVDGLITNEPGLMLTTSHADCTPIFFADPVKKAIGMTHSGWKGTAGMIGAETVAAMQREFGSDPKDIVAAIGPCICADCYEVGPEVAEIFISRYGAMTSFSPLNGTGAMLRPKENGKFLLDQRAINVRVLMDAGVKREHIFISNLCTFERDDIFFSHRKMGEKRGNLRAFIMISDPDAARPLDQTDEKIFCTS